MWGFYAGSTKIANMRTGTLKAILRSSEFRQFQYWGKMFCFQFLEKNIFLMVFFAEWFDWNIDHITSIDVMNWVTFSKRFLKVYLFSCNTERCIFWVIFEGKENNNFYASKWQTCKHQKTGLLHFACALHKDVKYLAFKESNLLHCFSQNTTVCFSMRNVKMAVSDRDVWLGCGSLMHKVWYEDW